MLGSIYNIRNHHGNSIYHAFFCREILLYIYNQWGIVSHLGLLQLIVYDSRLVLFEVMLTFQEYGDAYRVLAQHHQSLDNTIHDDILFVILQLPTKKNGSKFTLKQFTGKGKLKLIESGHQAKIGGEENCPGENRTLTERTTEVDRCPV